MDQHPVTPHSVHYVSYPGRLVVPAADPIGTRGYGLRSCVIQGDVRTAIQALPTGLCRTVITSPPYWSLRDYAVPGQLGLEDDPDEFVASLVTVFNDVRRILTEDGTLWLNIGDSYTSGGRTWRAPDKKNPVRALAQSNPVAVLIRRTIGAMEALQRATEGNNILLTKKSPHRHDPLQPCLPLSLFQEWPAPSLPHRRDN
jgi:hypothetical protein